VNFKGHEPTMTKVSLILNPNMKKKKIKDKNTKCAKHNGT
jgi:hypothetical protein